MYDYMHNIIVYACRIGIECLHILVSTPVFLVVLYQIITYNYEYSQ